MRHDPVKCGGEGPITKYVKDYVLHTTLRSVTWPKDENCSIVAFVDNKTHSK